MPTPGILPATSVFLDGVRFVSACVVFLNHVTSREFSLTLPWVRWGFEAVVVFFVLSGFVIAYVTSCRERSLFDYSVARIARLYSVVVPALALTVVLDLAGQSIDSAPYSQIPSDHVVLRMLVNMLFLQQSWNFTVAPLSNGPFWSLAFEFWYYCLFGAYVFLTGYRRYVAIAILGFLAGPRILLFMPLWLLGVLAFHVYRVWQPSVVVRRLCFAAAAFSTVVILWAGNPWSSWRVDYLASHPGEYFATPFGPLFRGHSLILPENLLLGTLIAVLIVCVRGSNSPTFWKEKLSATIHYLAGATFTLYLFHLPLLYFFAAVFHLDKQSTLQTLAIAGLVFLSCMLLSYVGERNLGTWRRLTARCFKAVASWSMFARSAALRR